MIFMIKKLLVALNKLYETLVASQKSTHVVNPYAIHIFYAIKLVGP